MSTSLKRHEAETLFKAITNQYEERCKTAGKTIPTNQDEYFGFNDKADHSDSLKGNMEAHPKVADFLKRTNQGKPQEKTGYKKINGKYLYNKKQALEKEGLTEISLSSFYLTVYCNYLNCEGMEDFRKKFLLASSKVRYHAFYFSKRDYRVKHFTIDIELSAGRECEVEAWGFHEDRRKDPFKGTGIIKSSNLFVNLLNEEGIEMKLIFPEHSPRFSDEQYRHGVMLTISYDNFPVSVRLLMIKIGSDQQEASEPDTLRAERYLMFHQKNLRAPQERISSLTSLTVRDEPIENIVHMIGNYWVWHYSDKYLVQFKMEILPDFSVRIPDHPLHLGGNVNQIGQVSASRLANNCLCIGLRPENSFQILSFMMIEIPQSILQGNILRGSYCTVGSDNRSPKGGNLALYKDDDFFPYDELVPELILRKNIARHLHKYEDYAELIILRNVLEEVEKGT